ncbi:MAG: hypothetical protein AAGG11_06730 [Pseudomonadota bacterium]
MSGIARALMLLLLPTLAVGHAGHDERIKVLVSGAELILEVPVEADQLLRLDTNADGSLSVMEFDRDELLAVLAATCQLWTNGQLLSPSWQDVPVPGISAMAPNQPVNNVTLRRRYPLDARAPALLALERSMHAPGRELWLWHTAQAQPTVTVRHIDGGRNRILLWQGEQAQPFSVPVHGERPSGESAGIVPAPPAGGTQPD